MCVLKRKWYTAAASAPLELRLSFTTHCSTTIFSSLPHHPSPPLSALPLSDSGSEPQPLVSAWQQDEGGDISLSQRMMNKCVHPKTADAICIQVFILRTTPGHPEWIIAQEYKRGRGHFLSTDGESLHLTLWTLDYKSLICPKFLINKFLPMQQWVWEWIYLHGRSCWGRWVLQNRC